MPFIYVLVYEGYARGSCVRRWSLLQDCLPVKFQDVKFKGAGTPRPRMVAINVSLYNNISLLSIFNLFFYIVLLCNV